MATGIVSFNTNTETERKRSEIREQIVAKLSDKEYRDIFVSEQINTGLAFQIKTLREQRGLTQAQLGEKAGMAQSRVSVMEDANYSRFSLNTLKRLASAFDVALIVRFAAFSELANYFADLDAESLKVRSFDKDVFVSQDDLSIRVEFKSATNPWFPSFTNLSLANVTEKPASTPNERILVLPEPVETARVLYIS